MFADVDELRKEFIRRYKYREYNRSLWAVINPWGEIKKLQAFIRAMRDEDARAKNVALDMYAENELLRKYKAFAEGIHRDFVLYTEYAELSKVVDKLRKENIILAKSRDDVLAEWQKYLDKYDAKRDGAQY